MTRARIAARRRPVVIAHRGASGYLPEHTLAAKALAHAQGADFLEQDVVASRDGALVVLHDIHLDRVSDVADRFPGRARADGRFYARDFSLEELQRLRLHERVDAAGQPVYPRRFDAAQRIAGIVTLAEELAFVRELNRTVGRRAGVYPEIKRPAWHREEGIDLAPLVVEELDRAGFRDSPELVWLQCFDLNENKRLRNELKVKYRIVQLLADDSWGEAPHAFEPLRSAAGLDDVASVADAIGPWLPQLIDAGDGGPTALLALAHERDLAVHAYTARADELPPGFATLEALLDWLVEHGVDGIFTDFPARAVARFDQLALPPSA